MSAPPYYGAKTASGSGSGLYHLPSRGNFQFDVFASGRARQAFLGCLDEACERTGWIIHACIIMVNHFHIALETPLPNLVSGMHWLQVALAFGVRQEKKRLGFDEMSIKWAQGPMPFKQQFLTEAQQQGLRLPYGSRAFGEAHKLIWQDLDHLLSALPVTQRAQRSRSPP